MEFTPGTSLDNDLGKEMLRGASEDVQIQFVRNLFSRVSILSLTSNGARRYRSNPPGTQ